MDFMADAAQPLSSNEEETRMHVLMTGITGFIGSRLAMALARDGHRISALVRETSRWDILPECLQKQVSFYVIKDSSLSHLMEDAVKTNGTVDLVYHLASLYLPKHSYEDIPALISSNVMLGTFLLEGMKEHGIRNLVNAGTSWQHYRSAPYSPVNLYAATKQAFEDILQYYEEVAGIRAITLQLFDTYGKGDKRKKIVAMLRELSEKGGTLAMSPGEQLMDMVHIDDVVRAFLTAGDLLRRGDPNVCGVYGVSAGKRYTLRELAAIFEQVTGKKLDIQWGGRSYREREVMVPWTDARSLPGWHAEIDVQEGIRSILWEGAER